MCCCGTKAKKNGQLAKDLVCGMDIDSEDAAGQSDYQGKTYYFCAPGCKRRFDSNPQEYAK
jgi:YHS domain-containing protein